MGWFVILIYFVARIFYWQLDLRPGVINESHLGKLIKKIIMHHRFNNNTDFNLECS